AYCDSCDYAATDEKANCLYEVNPFTEEKLQQEKVHTPNAKTIEEVSKFFDKSHESFVKTLLYMAKDKVVAVLIPGNRELNEIKLVKVLGVLEHELMMADPDTVKEVTGAEVGFAGPIHLKKDIKIIVDSRVTKMSNFIVGANENDYHIKNINYGRDFEGEVVEDILLVQEGDKCPKCEAALKMDRGIEVGNIFQLGLKYSNALKATFLDENGKEQKIFMGSHGVGVTRTASAIIEQFHDEHGVIWPLSVAPYHAVVTIVNVKNEEQVALGEKLYNELSKSGLDVLIDDRNERAGVKFKDADLIGVPIRITVGKRANEEIVEFSLRREGEKTEISVNEIMDRIRAEFAYQGLEV
ncbi:MAG: proline--tRNA ligase, partial [Tissierellales bacterium]